MNVILTNGTSYVAGNASSLADLPAAFIPTNSPSGWPWNTHLVLRPNTNTFNPNDPYWNFPDGSPNKVLEANVLVDVFTNFAGQTVTFQGRIGSNSIPGLAAAAPRGAIGLGSWNTSVQYSNIVVTSNGVTLYQSDFVNQGAAGWTVYNGTWSVISGLYRQTAITSDCRSTTGNTNWANYTITLRARKIGGSEGFLILFNWLDSNNWTWWNVGGWNNTLHAIERSTAGSKTIIGSQIAGAIVANTWYDLRIELSGPRIRCSLNGALVHDVEYPAAGPPTSGWEAIACVKEFTSSYGWVGMAAMPLRADSTFSVSRAIAPGRICQYGFVLKGPNTAPGSPNSMTGVGILVEDPDPLITGGPFGGGTTTRGGTTGLSVIAVGGSALSYQWRRNGVNLINGGNISGADTATLNISNAQLSDTGEYTVRVSNLAGSVVSQPAQLTVLCVLANELDPFVLRNLAGNTNGTVFLTWDSCSDHLYEIQVSDDPSSVTGWVPRALMIGADGATSWAGSNAPAADRRFYRVQRFSFAGDQDGDGLANLDEFNRGTGLRNPDSDGDHLPDGWEVKYALSPLDPSDASADLDGDGYRNSQEYELHTRPNAAYSQPAQLPRGLVAWWQLDEQGGTNVFDSSRNNYDGYVLGGNPSGVWTAGYLSNAVTLGGPSDNSIKVPYRPGLSPSQDLTLMGWVRPAGQGVLIGNWDPVGQVPGNYLLQFGPEIVEFRFSPAGDGAHSTIQFNPMWSTNDWHHIAVCYRDGTNLTVFVDGEGRASQTVMGPFVPVANSILIGFPGLTNAFSVDDVRLYDRALATNEIVSLTRGHGLPLNMIVGQSASLRVFGAADTNVCQWRVLSGQGFFTNTVNSSTEFRPSWSGPVTLQVVWENAGVLHTNSSSTTVAFPALSPLSAWNDGGQVQYNNNCYNFATDIRTDTRAQPGGPPFYFLYTCPQQTSAAISDGLQAGVEIADLCHTSGLPTGHLVALLIWPNWDFHYVRMEANGTWSSKAGQFSATTLDNSGQPILDPRTANFGSYQFCGFFWVGPDVNILHYPQ